MLSLFRRPGAEIEVDKTVLQAGDELSARVTLVPKQDFDVRQGKVELICTETYVLMTSSQYGQHYHRKTHALSRTGGSFLERGTVRAGLPHYGDVRLTVPADALPTLTGVSVNKIDPGISWTVTASLDVAKSRDIQHSQEVTVFRPARPEDSSPRPAVAESRHGQCVLTLELSSGDARSGIEWPAACGPKCCRKWVCRRSGSSSLGSRSSATCSKITPWIARCWSRRGRCRVQSQPRHPLLCPLSRSADQYL